MEFLQLRYFYETAQNENIAKTAKKFMVPPSSVSVSIKRLEKELGTDLFDRSANKIKLNHKGYLFLQSIEEIFEKLEDTVGKISPKEVLNKEICILIKARRKWLTELIVHYKKTHPDVQFLIYNDIHTNDIEKFDIVIDEDSDTYRGFKRFLLSVEEICIKASKDSLLAGKKLAFSQLKNQPFVMPRKAIGIRKLLEETGKKHGFEPNITIECNDSYCLSRYVEEGMGLTLGSRRALNEELEKNIVSLDVTDFNEIQLVYVYYKKNGWENAHIKEFCDFLYTNEKGLS